MVLQTEDMHPNLQYSMTSASFGKTNLVCLNIILCAWEENRRMERICLQFTCFRVKIEAITRTHTLVKNFATTQACTCFARVIRDTAFVIAVSSGEGTTTSLGFYLGLQHDKNCYGYSHNHTLTTIGCHILRVCLSHKTCWWSKTCMPSIYRRYCILHLHASHSHKATLQWCVLYWCLSSCGIHITWYTHACVSTPPRILWHMHLFCNFKAHVYICNVINQTRLVGITTLVLTTRPIVSKDLLVSYSTWD